SGDVENSAARPFLRVAVDGLHRPLAGDVGRVVREQKVTVTALRQGLDDRAEQVRLLRREMAFRDEVEHRLELRIALIARQRVVAGVLERRDLRDGEPKGEEVLRADRLADL